MAEHGPSTTKSRKLTDSPLLFKGDFLLKDEISAVLFSLCSCKPVLLPYKFVSCNAATSNGGTPFLKAFCDVEQLEKGFVLGDIFRRGITILIDFLYGKIPEAKHERILLEILVRFLKSGEMVDLDFENKADMTAVLANHLFGKLAISSWYTIDEGNKLKSGQKENKCSCSDKECVLTGGYGDTSIGNPNAWHGSVDIIIRNEIAIQNLEEESEIPSTKSPKHVNLRNDSQLVAGTVVSSFLQKRLHPDLSNFLIPSIGIADDTMVIMFYDSEHDVFLESSPISIKSISCEYKFSLQAVIITWLAINYRFLCTGLTDSMIPYKAGFFQKAKDKLNIYENELRMQNVGPAFVKDTVLPSKWHYSAFLIKSRKRISEWPGPLKLEN
ncbi:uncharacterized protein LOC133201487 [Saccostrea echinata]|uniref:uncharacterized protein LOC133201487 n=1 Tax=Saccostrea echinata TaxID=191078 RepID=UPI002A7F842F|nr:uncharacterized protein LOC133201487 [Saccostrea echinata]